MADEVTERELEQLVAEAREHFRENKKQAKKAARKIKRWKRVKMAAARGRKHWRAILKSRVERLKRRRNRKPRFDPSMLNGYPATITDKAKREIAIQVVVFGHYVTSTSRSWGGTSYHEQRPTPGNDAAASLPKMIAYQRYLIDKRLSELLESFGPDNDLNSKNGVRISQAEGSPNEDLHDNHNHQMWR